MVITSISFVIFNVFINTITLSRSAESDKYKRFEINLLKEWVINGNITQYSAYLLRENNLFSKEQYIEAFIILSFELESIGAKKIQIEKYLKCFYKFENALNKVDILKIRKISFMPVKGVNKKLYRIRCRINENLNSDNLDSIKVAIVAENEFENNKIPIDYIQYQKTSILNMNKPDKLQKGVAHCVHMLRNLDERRRKRLINWIEQQKAIGISEIRIYMYDVSNELVDLLESSYQKRYLKLIKHPIKYEEVCKHQIMNAEMYPESSIYKNLLNNCKNAHSYHFEMSDDLVFNTHERINTNDCFFSYKYEYKYVTTYDFDEIIFPRQNKMDHDYGEIKCKNYLRPKLNLNYNIYEFADALFKQHSIQVSCLQFENVVFFQNDDKSLINFVSNLYNNTATKKELTIQNSKKNVVYSLDSQDYVKNLKNKLKLLSCMKQLIIINSTQDSIWFSNFASLMNIRMGKSIYHTYNSEGINQHYTDIKRSKRNHCVKIPLYQAFCSHFRESLDFLEFELKDKTFSIKDFLIDIEYSMFISKF